MNREQRIAIWVATLIGMLVAWKLFGQSFGSFVRDQPFLAANAAATTQSFCTQTNFASSNAMLWFSADALVTNLSGTGFPANNETVGAWGSHGTNSLSVSNTPGLALTVWSNAVINGQPIITFGNSGGRLENNTFNLSQPFTVIIVHGMDQVPSTSRGLLSGTNDACSSEVDLRITFDGSSRGAYRLYAGSFIDGGSIIYTITNRTSWIVSAQVNGASSWIKTNGVTYVSGNSGANQLQGLQLSCICDLTGVFTKGIAEVILMNFATSSNDVFAIERYLSCKYQITNSVLTGQ